MSRFLVAAILALAPAFCWASDLIDLGDVPDGEHAYKVVIKDGRVTSVVPLRVFKAGQPSPPTNPPPTADTPLQARVKTLTREAIAAGGKPETAAKLAGVYALISDLCLDGTVSPDMVRGTAAKPGFLTAATDEALKGLTDKDKWTAWRQGIGTELALRHPAGAETTKELLAGTLREVSSAIKSHLGSQVEAGILDGIDWQAIIELLRPIIRDLLLKFLTDWIKKQ